MDSQTDRRHEEANRFCSRFFERASNEVTERTQQFYVQLQQNIRLSMTRVASLLAIKFGVSCISVV